MTLDIIQPKKGLTEYKEELFNLLDKQQHFINGAKEEADKGFIITAKDLLRRAESLALDIEFVEEMIGKVSSNAPMRIVK